MQVANVSNFNRPSSISIQSKNNSINFGTGKTVGDTLKLATKTDSASLFSFGCCSLAMIGVALALILNPLKKLFKALTGRMKNGVERAKAAVNAATAPANKPAPTV